jgi:hypothetical protein
MSGLLLMELLGFSFGVVYAILPLPCLSGVGVGGAVACTAQTAVASDPGPAVRTMYFSRLGVLSCLLWR